MFSDSRTILPSIPPSASSVPSVSRSFLPSSLQRPSAPFPFTLVDSLFSVFPASGGAQSGAVNLTLIAVTATAGAGGLAAALAACVWRHSRTRPASRGSRGSGEGDQAALPETCDHVSDTLLTSLLPAPFDPTPRSPRQTDFWRFSVDLDISTAGTRAPIL
jgi:hypothetical protein